LADKIKAKAKAPLKSESKAKSKSKSVKPEKKPVVKKEKAPVAKKNAKKETLVGEKRQSRKCVKAEPESKKVS
jgi:hypothetical protein